LVVEEGGALVNELEDGGDAGVEFVGREGTASLLEAGVAVGELDGGDDERGEGPANTVAAGSELATSGLEELGRRPKALDLPTIH
jgi:hypothetical protein